jgi:hypothetical protein
LLKIKQHWESSSNGDNYENVHLLEVKESTDGRLGVCKVLSSNPRTVRKKSIDGEKAYQRVRKREEELFYLDIFKSMAPTV